jgi:hypothetical protein
MLPGLARSADRTLPIAIPSATVAHPRSIEGSVLDSTILPNSAYSYPSPTRWRIPAEIKPRIRRDAICPRVGAHPQPVAVSDLSTSLQPSRTRVSLIPRRPSGCGCSSGRSPTGTPRCYSEQPTAACNGRGPIPGFPETSLADTGHRRLPQLCFDHSVASVFALTLSLDIVSRSQLNKHTVADACWMKWAAKKNEVRPPCERRTARREWSWAQRH